ncbi:MAG: hypothetical protein AAF353_21100, partial [Pseudomonadota bacterium]
MSERIFEAPGPGTWTTDGTHLPKPLSRYSSSMGGDGTRRGFIEGTERYGVLFSHTVGTAIHDFWYAKSVFAGIPEDAPPGPLPPGFFDQPEIETRLRNGPKAIKEKLWREDLRRWDEEVKPDSIRRHQELQAVDLTSLDTDGLIDHLQTCYDNITEMWYRHHIFTVGCIFPVGLYLVKMGEWTEVSSGEALAALKGSSPVSLGVAYQELQHLAKLLREAGIEASQFENQSAADTLTELRSIPGPIGAAVEAYLEIVGYQLTSGYDITERFALETPEILITGIFSVLSNPDQVSNDEVDEITRVLRNRVPEGNRAEFDSLLVEARLVNRLRDERGVYNEGKAFGLARRAVLEAGRRLQQAGSLHDANALVHASHEEMLAMLRGQSGPSETELRERENWYNTMTCDDVPGLLGPPPEP